MPVLTSRMTTIEISEKTLRFRQCPGNLCRALHYTSLAPQSETVTEEKEHSQTENSFLEE